MKVQTINVQITKCPKPYESVRLGGEWTVDKGETAEEVMSKALEILNQFYADSINQKAPKTVDAKPAAAEPEKEHEEKPEAEPEKKKQPLRFMEDSKTLSAIAKRIEAGIKLDKVLEFYEPDADAMRVLKAAAEFNKNQTVDK